MNFYLNEAVQSIAESIRFDSSSGKRTANMPFGKGAYDCLEHFLNLAARLGFETHNYDGYAGEVIFGAGEREFAILCHLDVVPAGDGWSKPPFGGVVEDGKIWGAAGRASTTTARSPTCPRRASRPTPISP